MSERLLQQALLEACEKEFTPFEDGGEHRFSRRHKKKMMAMFKEFSGKLKRKMPLKRRIIVVVIAVLLAALTGVTAVAVAKSFGIFNVSVTHTTIGVTGTTEAPKQIEDIYYLPELPEGYIVTKYEANENWVEWFIIKKENPNCMLLFDQYVKDFYTINVNNGNDGINFINVGEYEGYCVDFGYDQLMLAWDHGDYVLSFFSTNMTPLTVDDLIELALTVRVDPELEYGLQTWDF